MDEVKNADIYRVCAVSNDRWDVYQEPRTHPLASFSDKAAALNYAMCLARGRVAWHLLLRSGEGDQPGMVAVPNDAVDAPSNH